MKRCCRCKIEKPIDSFTKCKRKKDGLNPTCKECIKAYSQVWYKSNKIKSHENTRKWRAKNSDREKELSRIRYSENPEIRERQKNWNHQNSARANGHYSKWRKNNPEKVKEYKLNRYIREKNASGRIAHSEWVSLCEKYNYTCLCCKRRDIKLTLDHIIPLILGGSNTIDNAQPLCKTCNSKKGARFIMDYRLGFSFQ